MVIFVGERMSFDLQVLGSTLNDDGGAGLGVHM